MQKKRTKLSTLVILLLSALILLGAAAAVFYFVTLPDLNNLLIARGGTVQDATVIDYEMDGRGNFRIIFEYQFEGEGATTFAYTAEEATDIWLNQPTISVIVGARGSVQADFGVDWRFWTIIAACALAVILVFILLIRLVVGLIKRARNKEPEEYKNAKFLSYARKGDKCSVQFAFKDQYDTPHVTRTKYKYTVDQCEYLGERIEFGVLVCGKKAKITEDLSGLENWAEKRFGENNSRAYDEESGKRVDWEVVDPPEQEEEEEPVITEEMVEDGEEPMEHEEEILEEYQEEQNDEVFYEELRETIMEMIVEILHTEGKKMVKGMLKDMQKDMSKKIKKAIIEEMENKGG